MKHISAWKKFLSLAVVLTMMTGLLPMQSLAFDDQADAAVAADQQDEYVRVPDQTRNGGTITQISRHEYNVTITGKDAVVITTDQHEFQSQYRWTSDHRSVGKPKSMPVIGSARVEFPGESGDVVISYQELVGGIPTPHYETRDYFIFHVNVVGETTLTYETNGGSPLEPEHYPYGQVVELTRGTVRAGYQFTGWYADPDCTQLITSIQMNGDQTVYAGWDVPKIPEPLNSGEHFRYAYGSPDGMIHPEDPITRAEVATLMYNLLKDEVREEHKTDVNPFNDVNEDDWFNTYVSTMVSMGAISGYPNGSFGPYAPMTRGEFTAMMVTLDEDEPTVEAQFPDTEGHWAEAAISKAALNGWVAGHPDGTFQPDRSITRGEAFSILNAMLGRRPAGLDSLLVGMKLWPDNMDTSKWYYLAVQEATTSHDYVLHEDMTEDWTKLK